MLLNEKGLETKKKIQSRVCFTSCVSVYIYMELFGRKGLGSGSQGSQMQ